MNSNRRLLPGLILLALVVGPIATVLAQKPVRGTKVVPRYRTWKGVVTSIAANTGVVTLKNTATRGTFRLKLRGARGLNVGQIVNVNSRGGVSVGGGPGFSVGKGGGKLSWACDPENGYCCCMSGSDCGEIGGEPGPCDSSGMCCGIVAGQIDPNTRP